jgi:dolichol-phosphate mannosyltransferase
MASSKIEKGFHRLPGARLAIVKGWGFNMSSATNITSYKPEESRAKPVVHPDDAAPMARGEKIAVVIPTLYEAGNLGALLSAARAVLGCAAIAWEIIVVDDESRDGTEAIVTAVACEDPRVRLLVRRGERGLAGAILHGWRHTDATILGVIDADGQHPPQVLAALLDSIRAGHDVAIASRYVRGGRCESNPIRRVISMAASEAARRMQSSHQRVTDPLSGFFLVRRRCLENVFFQTSGFKILLEILVRGRIDSIEEVPFVFGRRRAGRSKVSAKVAWDYAALLVRLYRNRVAASRIPQSASGD